MKRSLLAVLLLALVPNADAAPRKRSRSKNPPAAAPSPEPVQTDRPELSPAPPAAVQLELPPPPAPARTRPMRVAVPDLRAKGPIPDRVLAAFSASLAPELRKLEGISALAAAELREMLAAERQRQMVGCGLDDTSCIAELAGAMDVDEVVTGELALVETSYTVTLSRLDVRRAKVLQSLNRRIEKRDGEELLAVVGELVEALYPERTLRTGRVRGITPEVAKRLNPPPLPRWVFFSTAGASAAALGAGAVFGLMSNEAKRDFLSRLDGTEPASGTELKSLEQRAADRATTANILFITGGALALATVVEAFFTDFADDRAAFLVVPGGGGGAVSVSGSF